MDYELSEEQKLIQETAYKFAVNEIEPIAKDCDREERYQERFGKRPVRRALWAPLSLRNTGALGLGS